MPSVKVTPHGRPAAVVKERVIPMSGTHFLKLCEKHKTSEEARHMMEDAIKRFRADLAGHEDTRPTPHP